MQNIVEIAFWLSIISVSYVYIGYYLILYILSCFCSEKKTKNAKALNNICRFSVSIIIAAYNEENSIKKRIENILTLDYPKGNIEIIIVSDGSTDKTLEIIETYKNYGVKAFSFKRNRGRAAVQNYGVNKASSEIIIFTDAETEFQKDLLRNIVNYFSQASVGCVVGNLIYKTKNSSISESEVLYWIYEKKIRKMESDLGILATATGACMAIKKNLWKVLTPIDDCDFTTPIDAILQGYKVVYAPDSIAYDIACSSIKGEINTRIRQTSKNLIGTLKRWGWKGFIKHPFVSWSLISHKLLRWFTPFFMIGAFLSNSFLLDKGIVYQAFFIGQVLFYLLALLGFGGELIKKRIVVASAIFSFCIANIGMCIGVIKGIIGMAPAAYKGIE